MNKDQLLRKIKEQAKEDQKKRRDPRFISTMAFLVGKGFLKAGYDVHPLPNLRLRVEDAIWAGENVEPRILEVLPAAVLRLGKHFNFNREMHPALATIVDQLRKQETSGSDFFGIPFEKIKVWSDFSLPDKRIKRVSEKKLIKTFRLEPVAVEKLREMAGKQNCTETEILEKLIQNA